MKIEIPEVFMQSFERAYPNIEEARCIEIFNANYNKGFYGGVQPPLLADDQCLTTPPDESESTNTPSDTLIIQINNAYNFQRNQSQAILVDRVKNILQLYQQEELRLTKQQMLTGIGVDKLSYAKRYLLKTDSHTIVVKYYYHPEYGNALGGVSVSYHKEKHYFFGIVAHQFIILTNDCINAATHGNQIGFSTKNYKNLPKNNNSFWSSPQKKNYYEKNIYPVIIDLLKDNMASTIPTPCVIREVGAGFGYLAKNIILEFDDQISQYQLCEPNAEAYAACLENLTGCESKLTAIQSTAGDAFPEQQYEAPDVLIASGVFADVVMTVDEAEQEFCQAISTVKAGGLILITQRSNCLLNDKIFDKLDLQIINSTDTDQEGGLVPFYVLKTPSEPTTEIDIEPEDSAYFNFS